MLLTMLDRGDCFGELAFLDGEPRATDAVAEPHGPARHPARA